MLDFLTKIPFSRGLKAFCMIFGLFIAPFWYLHQFAPGFKDHNNLINSIMLPICVSAPGAILFSLVAYASFSNSRPKVDFDTPDNLMAMLAFGSGTSGGLFYIPSVSDYLLWHVTLQDSIIILAGCNIGGIVGFIVGNRLVKYRDSRKEQKDKASEDAVSNAGATQKF